MLNSSVLAATKERAVLAQVGGAGIRGPSEESLEELSRLAESAGAEVLGTCVQRHGKPRASMLMGQGKLDQLGLLCREKNIDLVIFDNDLTPSQMANLDRALGVKVIDRTELVLQVFAGRAHTHEAQIQVEMAQLQYLMPRLAATTKQMSRQRGGIGILGAGEAPLEVRSRNVRTRIKHLKDTLNTIAIQRRIQNKRRRQLPSAALVGYTNVGKSTLLNALTDAQVYVDDRLFATLDSTSRPVELPGGQRIIISDTVGFIRSLPHQLIASFRSTLSEVREADVIVHVVDATHSGVRRQIQVVQETLQEIGAQRIPRMLVFNKIDLVPGCTVPKELRKDYPDSPAISAFRNIGLTDLTELLSLKVKDYTGNEVQ